MSGQEGNDKSLEKSITRWQWGIGIYVFLSIVLYFGWFKIVKNYELSQSADVWGQAGDFFGGMLNPIVALAAFFWLTKGVRLQQKELADTKAALEASERHQAKQVKISAITALLNASSEEYENFKIYQRECSERLDVAKKNFELAQRIVAAGNQCRNYDELSDIHLTCIEEFEHIRKSIETVASEKGNYLQQLKNLLAE